MYSTVCFHLIILYQAALCPWFEQEDFPPKKQCIFYKLQDQNFLKVSPDLCNIVLDPHSWPFKYVTTPVWALLKKWKGDEGTKKTDFTCSFGLQAPQTRWPFPHWKILIGGMKKVKKEALFYIYVLISGDNKQLLPERRSHRLKADRTVRSWRRRWGWVGVVMMVWNSLHVFICLLIIVLPLLINIIIFSRLYPHFFY